MVPAEQVTRLLRQWTGGDAAAYDQLFPLLYDQLRQIAARVLSAEAPGKTLSATALVHEAYIKMLDVQIDWNDRVHFLAIAARVMRRILVDNARSAAAEKRGSGQVALPLVEDLVAGQVADDALLILDDALEKLSKFDARKAQTLELMYFGGMTAGEIGGALSLSESTVMRDLRFAKAWLRTHFTTAPA